MSEVEFSEIGRRLRKVVQAYGVPQIEFCRRAAITPSQLSNWLAGRSQPSLAAARRIKRAYGVPLDWLFDGDSEDKLPYKIWRKVSENPSGTDTDTDTGAHA